MRLAIDTNVLVRYITSDDPQQLAAAQSAIEGDDVLFISTVVLCELAWVLKGTYKYSRAEIERILTDLVITRNVEADFDAAQAGLHMLARGGDFADGVIEYEAARAKCDRLVTFDQNFARCAATPRVTLLATT